ncbi:helix-turn-helix domain-containing protein [Leptospira santarosai]|uniref:helix-turn-helix domain-containing protein n=1 Tax=Leptospira santarosai TaxID=28183 RepID=UPI00095B82CA|nr:helix-turn-helix transcriptional regulator [Leptospira santarosai]MDI7230618.1 helix-turn-helix transcriptional regulator [Leptospira santarosai]OLY64815.1 transcriptional regulator [Leptospira santarosai serovar Grippotyphosa]ONF77754.1 transcriptional regulator [Leptospira santarosai serovar Bananal]
MNLSEKIKELRKKNGISQQGLADKLGIHLSHVSRIENGHNEPSLEVLRGLMQIFEVSADFLLKDDLESFEIEIKDKSLAERIRLLDSLDEKNREALLQVIDNMLTNQRMKQLLATGSEK